jgi:sec-independent protein translocase protein TatA
MPTLFAFLFSPYDMFFIALLALLFFGNRLPSVMRNLGEGITEFKKGMNGPSEDDEEEDDRQPRKQPPRKLDDRSRDDRDQSDDRGRLDDSAADSDADDSNAAVRKFDEVRKPA